MKDHLIALIEAVRLARIEIECYRDPRCTATAEWTLKRLGELLDTKDVSDAMATLVPGERDCPSVVPEQHAPSENLRVPYPWRSH